MPAPAAWSAHWAGPPNQKSRHRPKGPAAEPSEGGLIGPIPTMQTLVAAVEADDFLHHGETLPHYLSVTETPLVQQATHGPAADEDLDPAFVCRSKYGPDWVLACQSLRFWRHGRIEERPPAERREDHEARHAQFRHFPDRRLPLTVGKPRTSIIPVRVPPVVAQDADPTPLYGFDLAALHRGLAVPHANHAIQTGTRHAVNTPCSPSRKTPNPLGAPVRSEKNPTTAGDFLLTNVR